MVIWSKEVLSDGNFLRERAPLQISPLAIRSCLDLRLLCISDSTGQCTLLRDKEVMGGWDGIESVSDLSC